MPRNTTKRARPSENDQENQAAAITFYDNVPGTSMTHSQSHNPYHLNTLNSATSGASSYVPFMNAQEKTNEEPSMLSSVTNKPSTRGTSRGRPRGRPRRPRGGTVVSRGVTASTRAHAKATEAADQSTWNEHKRKAPVESLSDAEETAAQGDAPMDPLTFQCRNCFRMLGDTFSFLSTDSDLGYVVLSAVSELVLQSPSFETSTDQGKDHGSTFARLVCAGCQSSLGRYYRTTPRELDTLRDCFSLDVGKIFTYQLGSNQTKQLETTSPDRTENLAEPTSISLDQKPLGTIADGSEQPKIEKTMAFTIELSERLIKAEDDIRHNAADIQQLFAAQSKIPSERLVPNTAESRSNQGDSSPKLSQPIEKESYS